MVRAGTRGAAGALAAVFFCTAAWAAGSGDDALVVPSPDWRDQVVYFAMIDRFANGDRANDDQGAGEFDPSSPAHYSGGDLRGLAARLDYIRGLGATALWITPPVAHRWWDPSTQYGGYHGYWTDDFEAVDPHFGTLADYRRLARGLHDRGMYLVQDVVVNHTANYFRYPGRWDPEAPELGYVPNPDHRGRSAPARWPFSQNDPRDAQQRAAAIYHWTPAIRDATSRAQELSFQLADLDDLATGNPVVRTALRRSYAHWIRAAGVDAFRVDTAFYVPPEFFRDFLESDDPDAPGVLRVARASGRAGFHVFGEGFAIDPPFADAQARKIESYVRDDAGPLLPGMLNFPLYGTTLDVFARGRATAAMSHRIASMMRVHANPHLMPSFVDNHDVDRFLAGGSREALEQALLLVMTLPGIPTIYYGTEQGFTLQRAAMFAQGYGSGGRDRFDTGAPLYRYIARLAALRRAHRVFSRGVPEVLADDAAGPGVLAYRMRDGDTQAFVAFNTAAGAALLDRMQTGLDPGRVLEPAFALGDTPRARAVDADGRVSLVLPPRSGVVYLPSARTRRPDAPRGTLHIDPVDETPATGDLRIGGSARGIDRFVLVVDGDLDGAREVRCDGDGRWSATLDTASMVDPAVAHRVVAWSPGHALASEPRRFRVARRWTLLAEAADPPGDDHGPSGTYRYPEGAGWSDRRPADIRAVRVYGSGPALKVELGMRAIVSTWNPPNGFDHVAFTLFVAVPGAADTSRVMPRQNALLPEGMRWSHRLRVHGWSNALFSARGATAAHEGEAIVPGAELAVDRARGTVTFTFPAAALGSPHTLSGTRIHVATWDYDGGYRPLSDSASTQGFRGGDGTRDPLVMDDATVTLP